MVNDAIVELMSTGKITSATLMVNAPAFEDAIARISGQKDCSFGVHLYLTMFAPLPEPKACCRYLTSPRLLGIGNVSAEMLPR
jgi:chitin disaccharide deacetylase